MKYKVNVYTEYFIKADDEEEAFTIAEDILATRIEKCQYYTEIFTFKAMEIKE